MNISLQHTKPASDRQKSWIADLLAQRDLEIPAHLAGYEGDSQVASLLIDKLLAAPKRNAPKRPEPGLYVLDGDVIKVQLNGAGTRVYAKRLVPSGTSGRGSWEYEQGLIDRLQGATPANEETMAAWGRRTGTCGVCGALLTNPESIERGIGPICAGRL